MLKGEIVFIEMYLNGILPDYKGKENACHQGFIVLI